MIRTLGFVAAFAAALLQFGATPTRAATGSAPMALNPQPLPPGRTIGIGIHGTRVALNPQPLPPGRTIVIGIRGRGVT